MNITRIVAASGAGVLAIAAVFAGTKPKATITTVFYTISNSCTGHSFTVNASHFTTGSLTGTQATIKTSAAGVRKTLWAVCTSGVPSKAVHFNP